MNLFKFVNTICFNILKKEYIYKNRMINMVIFDKFSFSFYKFKIVHLIYI